jgi:hypothetical protein
MLVEKIPEIKTAIRLLGVASLHVYSARYEYQCRIAHMSYSMIGLDFVRRKASA